MSDGIQTYDLSIRGLVSLSLDWAPSLIDNIIYSSTITLLEFKLICWLWVLNF